MNDREMFETYKEQVYRLCRHMLNHPSDAEDVCHHVKKGCPQQPFHRNQYYLLVINQ